MIAYGAHVDEAALADAAEAGCDQVLTRGQFNQQYAELLQSGASRAVGFADQRRRLIRRERRLRCAGAKFGGGVSR